MRHYITLAFATVVLASCQQSADAPFANENELRVSVLAGIEGSNASTRHGGEDVNNMTFQKDDEIGIFVRKGTNTANLTHWTLNASSNWVASSTVFWDDTTSKYSFEAFYPYAQTDSREEVPVPTLTEQSGSMSDLSKSDFMVATRKDLAYSDNNGSVSFIGDYAFAHKLTLFALTVSASYDLENAKVNYVTLSASGLVTSMTYSFDDGSFSPVEEYSSKAETRNGEGEEAAQVNNNLMTSTLSLDMGTSDKVLYYVLNPNVTEAITLTLNYTKDEHTYTASTKLNQVTTASGTQYTTKITVNNNTIILGNTEISSWGTPSVNTGDKFTTSTEDSSTKK
jgi:hypothetical protein